MNQQNLSVPIAIVVAGVFIAGALFFAGRGSAPSPTANGSHETAGDAENVAAVTASEHILGNPDADIVLIEYSDIECPFCKQFHITMKQIMNEYGKDGRVAWVYRHFPIAQLHQNAPRLAEASECVAELNGNTAFWAFVDEVFAIAPVNTFFPMGQLTATAGKVGVNAEAFDACLASGRHKSTVEDQFNNAVASGGQGTPHNIIVTKAGQIIPLPGAQPYSTVKNVIDAILAETPHQ